MAHRPAPVHDAARWLAGGGALRTGQTTVPARRRHGEGAAVGAVQSGLCALDPPGQIYARSVAQPTAELLEKFDAHLRDFALAVQQAAKRMGIEPPWTGAALTPRQQAQLPRLLTIYGEHWNTALDATFEAARLSPARRIDARRNLFSSSHWNLIHRAMLWHFQAANGRAPNGPALNGQALNGQALNGQPAGHADKDGILADQLAAQLLQLTGQTLQTTRDHIAWLLEIGLFERKPGRSLHVVISRRAAEEIGRALSATAARLPAMLQALNRQPAEFDDRGPLTDGETAERTLNVRPGNPAATLPVSYVPEPVHSLEVSGPDGVARRVPLRPPLTIGRTAPSDLVLSGVEVSRSHCRILEDGGRIAVEDMRSTNGTFLNELRVTSVVPLESRRPLADRLPCACLPAAGGRRPGGRGADDAGPPPGGIARVVGRIGWVFGDTDGPAGPDGDVSDGTGSPTDPRMERKRLIARHGPARRVHRFLQAHPHRCVVRRMVRSGWT